MSMLNGSEGRDPREIGDKHYHKYEIRVCKICHKEFSTRRDGKSKYCSHECYAQAIRLDHPKICKYCGKQFENKRKRMFCSKACQDAARDEKVLESGVCKYCGKEFKRHICARSRMVYCSKMCLVEDYKRRKCEECPSWKGGRSVTDDGYIYLPWKHQLEHRAVMEKVFGRPLTKDEVVHHIDGNKQNNDPSNLMVLTNSEHMKLHGQLRREAKMKASERGTE